MKKVFFLLLLSFSHHIFAQVGGENVFTFLDIPVSARQAALGGEVLTAYYDVNQPLWNPSTINKELDNQLAVTYIDYLADINLGSLTFAHLFSRRFGTVHAGISYINYGKFIGADENGNETGTFSSNDIAVSLGYAYRIPKTDLYTGANIKWINSKIENFTSSGFAADLALTWYKFNRPYIFSMVIRNIGYQVNVYDEERRDLPLNVAVGASYKLENIPLEWHITLNNLQRWNLSVANPSNNETFLDGETKEKVPTFLDNTFRHVSVGAEFFPDGGFNLRLGYNFRRAAELRLTESRTFAGISAGFSIKFRSFKFDYAFTKYHPVTNTNTFTLNIDLSKPTF